MVEHVRSSSAMEGFAKEHGDPTTQKPATQLLREKREREKRDCDDHSPVTE